MRISFVLIFLLLTGLSVAQEVSTSTLLLKPIVKNADAVVRLDEMQVEITAKDKMTFRVRRVITVLNANGNQHAKAIVGYNNSGKIEELQAVVYNAFGKEIKKIREKEFRDVSAVSGGMLYSDSRVKYLEYTPVEYPYTVDFTYERSSPNTAVLPTWYFLDDYRIAVEKSVLILTYPSPDLRPDCRGVHLEGLDVKTAETANSIRYEATDIPAMEAESLSPGRAQLMPHILTRMIHFNYEGYSGSTSDWNEMGRWIHNNLLQGQDELPEGTKARIRALVKNFNDPREKAKVVYKYVQDNTRYISVQVGIGGFKPISALEVDRVKYGDCKGLSNYTRSLLKAVGITAYYCHVEAGNEKVDFEEGFADLKQGNHAILAIPDEAGYTWIDCTSHTNPYGFLGSFTDDRKVLVVKPNGGELIRTPAYLNDSNRQDTKASYALSEDGSIEGEVAISTRGIQYNQHFGLEKKSYEDRLTHYKSYWSYINNLALTSFTFENNTDSIVFREQVQLKAANYSSNSGNLMLFTPNAFNRSTYIPDRYRERKLPFEIQRGFLDEDEFEIGLPKEYQIEAMGENKSLNTEFGRYEMAMAYDEKKHSLHYHRKMFLKEGHYPKEKYEAYRDFRKAVASIDNAQIVLIKRPL